MVIRLKIQMAHPALFQKFVASKLLMILSCSAVNTVSPWLENESDRSAPAGRTAGVGRQLTLDLRKDSSAIYHDESYEIQQHGINFDSDSAFHPLNSIGLFEGFLCLVQ